MNAARSRTTAIGVTLLAAFVCGTGLARAQGATVFGTVRSDAGELIPGVTVTVPELSVHVSTAASGRYAFTVPAASARGQTVRVLYRTDGFRARAETLAARPGEHVLDVTLLRDPNALDAQIGTGVLDSTRRIATTIAVARLDTPAVPVPATDPLTQLAGRVPGLSIFSASGRPGRQPDVLLRGPTSLNAVGRSQGPLYIIDGVILEGGLPAVNPQDIATVEVVPGEAAGAIYGSRGARGVVSIITKSSKASADRLAFGFRSEVGVSDIEREIGPARQHALLTDETGRRFCVSDPTQPLCARTLDWTAETDRANNYAGDYAATPAAFAFDPGSGTSGPPLRQSFLARYWPVPTYNPVRQVMVSRPYVSTNVDVQSGGTGARYFASLSQLRQAGAIRYLDGFTRHTARLNVDQRVGDNLSLSFRTYFSRGVSDGGNQDGGGNLFFRLTRQPASANLLARDTLGRLYARSNIMNQGDQNNNPLMFTTGNGVIDETKTDRFIGGGTLRWSPVPWADVEAAFSYDRSTSRYERYIPKGFRTQGQAWTSYRGFLEYDNYGHEAYNGSLSLAVRHSPARDLSVRWLVRSLFERLDSYAYRMSGDSLAVRGIEDAANTTGYRSLASDDASERLAGLLAGVSLAFRETLFGDLVLRRDGSSLIGSADRWATFGRASFAYRVSQESWWPWHDFLNEFKLRASYGTAGGRPPFSAQYETHDIRADGTPSAGQLANPLLRPETSVEREFGADIEMFRRVGITLTYSSSDTKDQILPVPAPASTGFQTQWQNAGALQNKTWELSVNVPVVRRRDLSWSWRFNFDRTRTVITRLDVPPFTFGATAVQSGGAILMAREGERYGTIYGYYVLKGAEDCAKLPAPFNADCGTSTSSFQVNDDGWLVWVGRGNTWRDGLTKNLWMTRLAAGSAPWGVALNWGMLIAYRDSTGARRNVPLGNALPSWRFSISQNFQFHRLTAYALFEAVMGRRVWNQGRHWSYLDFINRDIEQRGRDPELAKPIGYYYRSSPPDHGSGISGLYQTLNPYNGTVEDASYAKLRELSLTYHVGSVGGAGNWDVSVIGRNVFTITKYTGFDPEVGIGGGQSSSATVNAIDAYTFPNLRTLTVAVSTRF
jgi:TonB-linked SusC/RagA family outer membrane protein